MNSIAKQPCPFMEKCYRKNPIHFSEMSHPHLEKLLINQLDGIIEIPEVLCFTCNDRTQLMDQLKVLQIVLRKERDQNKVNVLPATSSLSSKTESLSITVLDMKEDLKQKVKTHKKVMTQRREDKLKQMDAEAQALSRASSDEEASESKTRGKSLEPSSSSAKDKIKEISLEEIKQISLESNDKEDISDSQQDSELQSSSPSDANSYASFIYMLMNMYQACNSEKSRQEVRQKAISMIKHSFVEPGEFATKYALSDPYNIFFSRIEKSEETYNQQFSITFPEILDRSLGEIVNSLHLNFMVDVGWLCLQYLLAGQRTDMLILYGSREDDLDHEKLGSNITMINVEMPSDFGCHHSKIMILQYKDGGIRVVVSTANLYSDDWENRTQGLWISPHLPLLSAAEAANPNGGESPTGFKKDLKRYLETYKYPALTQWILAVQRADFSAVNVFFVASVPGTHKGGLWGYRKLAFVLLRHVTLPPDAPQWPIIAQSSSVGSFGRNFKGWLSKEIIASMSKESKGFPKSPPNFKFIYPSRENYKQSFDCQNLSCCLPYSEELHSKQEWIESYLCQWTATRTGRDRAMPHIKSYTRISPDLKSISWFVLTSANLSKAAWGVYRGDYCISSYEAGVIFIPKFVTKTTTFPIQDEEDPAVPVFPIPYDLPLSPYNSSDKPFVVEFLHALAEKQL
nr:PREDICTED: LOW QUALITY PROTEIN: probable tyrosyl-DNA phosphodiesterase [Linepithema humile]